MLGKIEGKRRRGQQRMRRLDSIMDSSEQTLQAVEDRGASRAAVPGVVKSWMRLSHGMTTLEGLRANMTGVLIKGGSLDRERDVCKEKII